MGIHKPTTDTVLISGYPENTLDLDNCYASNSIHTTFIGDALSVNDSATANYIYASMFIARTSVEIDGLVFENTSASDSGDDVRCGIWNSTAVNYPNAVGVQTGEVALDGSADVRVGTVADTTLAAGIYWIGLCTNATVAVSMSAFGNRWHNSSYGNPLWSGGVPSAALGPCWYQSHTYGSLPTANPTWYTKGPLLGILVK